MPSAKWVILMATGCIDVPRLRHGALDREYPPASFFDHAGRLQVGLFRDIGAESRYV